MLVPLSGRSSIIQEVFTFLNEGMKIVSIKNGFVSAKEVLAQRPRLQPLVRFGARPGSNFLVVVKKSILQCDKR